MKFLNTKMNIKNKTRKQALLSNIFNTMEPWSNCKNSRNVIRLKFIYQWKYTNITRKLAIILYLIYLNVFPKTNIFKLINCVEVR